MTSSIGWRPSTVRRTPVVAVVLDDLEQRRELLRHAGPGPSPRLVVVALDERASRRGRRRRHRAAGSRRCCRRGRWRRRSGGSASRATRSSAGRRCSSARSTARAARPRARVERLGLAARPREAVEDRAVGGVGRGQPLEEDIARSCRPARAGRGSCTGRPRARAACRRATAARNRSPDARTGTPSRSARIGAWVPFPAPGAPSRTMTVIDRTAHGDQPGVAST